MHVPRVMETTRQPTETLIDDDTLRVRLMRGSGTRLVLVFTGVRHSTGGMPLDEFAGLSSDGAQNNVLFISDIARSWYSAPGLIGRIVECVNETRAKIGAADCVAVGNSMGGYGAILMAAHLPVSYVAAFAPQISMHPDTIDERRWAEFRPDIGHDLPESLVNAVEATGAQVFVTFGRDSAPDMAQADLLPSAPNLHLYRLRGCQHDAARRLKETGLLRPVLAAMLAGDAVEVGRIYGKFEDPDFHDACLMAVVAEDPRSRFGGRVLQALRAWGQRP